MYAARCGEGGWLARERYLIFKVLKTRIEVMILMQHSVILKLCENNEEQFFYPIRSPGSFTELAPMRPPNGSGMEATVVLGGWCLFI